MKLPISGALRISSSIPFLHQAVLHSLGYRLHGLANIDGTNIERHRTGVNTGEVEDVVDDGKQRIGGDRNVAEIFVLLFRQRAG